MNSNVSEISLISFLKRILDPLIIVSLLYVLVQCNESIFTGYYLVLMIMSFFISSFVYEHLEPSRKSHKGMLIAYCRDIFAGWLIVLAILLFIGDASGLSYQYSDRVIILWGALTPFALLTSNYAVRKITSNLRKSGFVRSVVIVGGSETAVKLSERIADDPSLMLELGGYFEDRVEPRHHAALKAPLLGKLDHVAAYVRQYGIKILFISLPISAQPRIEKLIDDLKDTTASIYFLPDVYTFDLMQARFDNIGGVPVVAICESPFTGVNSLIKRISDIVLALLIQILLLPVMLAIAIAVKITSPGPVIFRQRRYGLYGEEIIVYKFRSMTVSEDGATILQAKKNDVRLTSIGQFLRANSLDELPQFVNVLQGRMSIVGPRPHAVAHNEQYRKLIKGYMLRHKVRPGITGWAQVNGLRGETDTLEKMKARVEFDLEYLRKWSLLLDLWIILRTILVVVRRQNAH